MTAFFLFEEDRLVCERVYFDVGTIMRQLGLAHDSRSVAGRLSMLASHRWRLTIASWPHRRS